MVKKSWIIILAVGIVIVLLGILFYIYNFSNTPLTECQFKFQVDGKSYIGAYCNVSLYTGGLDWLKQNTPENSVILAWWDESPMVRQFSNRDTVIFLPSKEYAKEYTGNRLGKITNYGGYTDNEKFKEDALAYSTLDIDKTKEIMKKYNAEYIFLTNNDYLWGDAISRFTGIQIPDCRVNDSRGYKLEIPEIGKEDCFNSINITLYNYQYCVLINGENKCVSSYNHDYCMKYFEISPIGTGGRVCLNENSTMYKMLKLQNIDGFEKVYSDNYTVIYKLQ